MLIIVWISVMAAWVAVFRIAWVSGPRLYVTLSKSHQDLCKSTLSFISLLGGFLFHISIVHFLLEVIHFTARVEVLMGVGMLGWVCIFIIAAQIIKQENIREEDSVRLRVLTFFVLGLDATIFFIMYFPGQAGIFGLPVLPMYCTWVHIVPCYSIFCVVLFGIGVFEAIKIGALPQAEKKEAFRRLQKQIKYTIIVVVLVIILFTAGVFFLPE